MARRLVQTLQNEKGDYAKVYRCSVWCEYVVRFFIGGEYIDEADYHADDLKDAIDSAKHTLNIGA